MVVSGSNPRGRPRKRPASVLAVKDPLSDIHLTSTDNWIDLEILDEPTMKRSRKEEDVVAICDLVERFGFENEFNAEMTCIYLAPSYLPKDCRWDLEDDILTRDSPFEYVIYNGPGALLQFRNRLIQWMQRGSDEQKNARQQKFEAFDRDYKEYIDQAERWLEEQQDEVKNEVTSFGQQQKEEEERAIANVKAELVQQEEEERLEEQRRREAFERTLSAEERQRMAQRDVQLELEREKEWKKRYEEDSPERKEQLARMRQKIDDEKIKKILESCTQVPMPAPPAQPTRPIRRATSIPKAEPLEMLPPRMSSPHRSYLAPKAKETILPPRVVQRCASPGASTKKSAESIAFVPSQRKVSAPPMQPLMGTETVRDAAKACRGKSIGSIGMTFSALKRQRSEEMEDHASGSNSPSDLTENSKRAESPQVRQTKFNVAARNQIKMPVKRKNSQVIGNQIRINVVDKISETVDRKSRLATPPPRFPHTGRPFNTPSNNNNYHNNNYIPNGLCRTKSPVGSRRPNRPQVVLKKADQRVPIQKTTVRLAPPATPPPTSNIIEYHSVPIPIQPPVSHEESLLDLIMHGDLLGDGIAEEDSGTPNDSSQSPHGQHNSSVCYTPPDESRPPTVFHH